MSASGVAIALNEVAKAWPGGGARIGPLNLEIAAGQFVALIGGSGCGKTTTLKMINGLVAPDAGAVTVAGRTTGAEAGHLLRRRIGYVFQEVGLFPHLTVAENIAIGPRLAAWSGQRTADRIAELLELVSLPRELAARLPAALSGGQRQRVGLARALAAEPAIMLMDEPFGALDPLVREALGAEYRALHERLGLTTVMVTHDVAEALVLADRVLVMEAGTIRADGTPVALLAVRDDAAVQALMEAPRRQARRLEALAAEAEAGHE
ncbi:MAG TPA: ATP-binding cassette domain-containing protein [Caulobacteraceae bacterium]|jgi:osmoprotectant transport system ATP-binding protein